MGAVALQESCRVPGKAIEEAVWRRVTADPDASEEIEPENASEEDFEF